MLKKLTVFVFLAVLSAAMIFFMADGLEDKRLGFTGNEAGRDRVTDMTVYRATNVLIAEPMPEYYTLMMEIHNSNTWVKDVYMCGDFSSDLFYILEDKGYDVWFCKGWYLDCDIPEDDFKCKHYWVIVVVNGTDVFLDPNFGSVADPSDYYRDYRCKRNPFV